MANYKVKHYWKDGASSVWEADKNLNKEIFEYLKKNYHSFVEKRPKSLLYKEHTISFKYIDGKDSFGREITDVTFYISNSKKVNKNIIIYLFIFLLIIISIFVIRFVDKNNPKPNNISNQIEKKILDEKDKWSKFRTDWNKCLDNDNSNRLYLVNNSSAHIISTLNKLNPFNDDVIDSNTSFDKFEKKVKEITPKKSICFSIKEIKKNL